MSEPTTNVFDTYLRGLRRLTRLAGDVAKLEAAVADHEASALRRILAEVDPLLPHLARPISVREPWLPLGQDKHYAEKGLVVSQRFQRDQGEGGRVTHHGKVLAVVAGGRLVELTLSGTWREGPPVSDASWRIEAREREPSPELARANLRLVLAGVLDALRDALSRARTEREALKRRLELLLEVDGVLSRGGKKKTDRIERRPGGDGQTAAPAAAPTNGAAGTKAVELKAPEVKDAATPEASAEPSPSKGEAPPPDPS